MNNNDVNSPNSINSHNSSEEVSSSITEAKTKIQKKELIQKEKLTRITEAKTKIQKKVSDSVNIVSEDVDFEKLNRIIDICKVHNIKLFDIAKLITDNVSDFNKVYHSSDYKWVNSVNIEELNNFIIFFKKYNIDLDYVNELKKGMGFSSLKEAKDFIVIYMISDFNPIFIEYIKILGGGNNIEEVKSFINFLNTFDDEEHKKIYSEESFVGFCRRYVKTINHEVNFKKGWLEDLTEYETYLEILKEGYLNGFEYISFGISIDYLDCAKEIQKLFGLQNMKELKFFFETSKKYEEYYNCKVNDIINYMINFMDLELTKIWEVDLQSKKTATNEGSGVTININEIEVFFRICKKYKAEYHDVLEVQKGLGLPDPNKLEKFFEICEKYRVKHTYVLEAQKTDSGEGKGLGLPDLNELEKFFEIGEKYEINYDYIGKLQKGLGLPDLNNLKNFIEVCKKYNLDHNSIMYRTFGKLLPEVNEFESFIKNCINLNIDINHFIREYKVNASLKELIKYKMAT